MRLALRGSHNSDRFSRMEKNTWRFRPINQPGWILAAVALTGILLFVDYHRERWRKGLVPRNNPQTQAGEGLVIRCDGLGYYAWLRSLLIDGDWSFDNEFVEHNVLGDFVPPPDWRTATGRRALPWSVGPACWWALLIVPAHFALQHLPERGLPWPADGYSMPYQLLVGVGTLLASGLGLFLLYGICRHYARPQRAALAAALLTLGTTIVFYGAIEVSMAHGVGTMAVAALLWYWLRTYSSVQPGRWLVVGLLVGFVALMRWQLVTFALLPLGEAALGLLRRNNAGRRAVGLALAAIGAAVGFLPQMVAWHCVYGQWLAAPIAMEPHWLTPSLGALLVSPDRGLFYWTPLAVIAFMGYFTLFTRRHSLAPRSPVLGGEGLGVRGPALARVHPLTPDPSPPSTGERGEPGSEPCANRIGTINDTIPGEATILLFVAFVVQIYVLGSLWGGQVYLGVSFGFRHLTEALVALAPGLAFLLERARMPLFRILFVVAMALVVWNLLLIAQYRYGLLPAAGGADFWTMATNCIRLMERKKALLVGQVLAGPLLLMLLFADARISWPRLGCGNAGAADNKLSGKAGRQTSRRQCSEIGH